MNKEEKYIVSEKDIIERKLNKIFEELIDLREDIDFLKKEFYKEKLKNEIAEKENEVNCRKETLFNIDNKDYWEIKERKRKDFYEV